MKSNKSIIFLYAVLEPYIIGSLEYFVNQNKDFDITVIKTDSRIYSGKNRNLKIYSILDIQDLLSFCMSIKPQVLIVSGRMEKSYLTVSKYYRNKIKTVMVSDGIFNLSLKGLFKILFQKSLYHRYFNYYWGVGSLQTAHALSLGFRKDKIFENFYTSAIEHNEPKITFNEKKSLRILSVARLDKEKNLELSASTIDAINNEFNFDIQFNIIGDGPLKKQLQNYKCVKLLGRKDQTEFHQFASENDIFCLPSSSEPWGVVLHEFINLGMPILASYNCGSAFNLVIEGYNGYKFKHDNQIDFKDKIIRFIELSNSKKKIMSKNSVTISKRFSNSFWAGTLKEIYYR